MFSPTARDATCTVILVPAAITVPLLAVTGDKRVRLVGNVSVTVAP
jgi:hypothetical protein